MDLKILISSLTYQKLSLFVLMLMSIIIHYTDLENEGIHASFTFYRLYRELEWQTQSGHSIMGVCVASIRD